MIINKEQRMYEVSGGLGEIKLVLKSFGWGQDSGRALIDCERKIFAKHNAK